MSQLQYNGRPAKDLQKNEPFWMPLFVKFIVVGFCLYGSLNLLVLFLVFFVEFQTEPFLGIFCSVSALMGIVLLVRLAFRSNRYLDQCYGAPRKGIPWSGSHWRKELERKDTEPDPMEEIKHLIRLQDERFERHRVFLKRVKAIIVAIWMLLAAGAGLYIWANSFTCGAPAPLEAELVFRPHADGYEIFVNSSNKDHYASGHYSGLWPYRVRLVKPPGDTVFDLGPLELSNHSTGNDEFKWRGLDVTWDNQTHTRHDIFGGPFSDPNQAQKRIDSVKAGYQAPDTNHQFGEGYIPVVFYDTNHDGLVTKGDRFILRSEGDNYLVGTGWEFQIWHPWYKFISASLTLP